MDELKIGKALKKKLEKETTTEEVLEEEYKPEIVPTTSGKGLFIAIVVLLGIFALTLGGFKYYNNSFTGAQVLSIDDLHLQNLAGELPTEQGYVYQGISFVFADGLWWTEIQQSDRLLKIPLHFGPREVQNVTIKGTLDPAFNNGTEIYMAIDPYFANPYYTLALSELNTNIVQGIRHKPVAACTEEHEICLGREILNCQNTQGKPVIQLQYGNTAGIELQGTCILITGEEQELVKAADRLIWQWYGVME